jgi:hypothetical protein
MRSVDTMVAAADMLFPVVARSDRLRGSSPDWGSETLVFSGVVMRKDRARTYTKGPTPKREPLLGSLEDDRSEPDSFGRILQRSEFFLELTRR